MGLMICTKQETMGVARPTHTTAGEPSMALAVSHRALSSATSWTSPLQDSFP